MENKTAEEILKRATMPNISVNSQFDAILSAMEAYAEQYKGKWIPISERQPGNDNWMRVCIGNFQSIIPCCFHGERWVEYGSYYNSIPNVTHWQEFNDLPPTQ